MNSRQQTEKEKQGDRALGYSCPFCLKTYIQWRSYKYHLTQATRGNCRKYWHLWWKETSDYKGKTLLILDLRRGFLTDILAIISKKQ